MNITKYIVSLSLLSAFAVTGLLSTPAFAAPVKDRPADDTFMDDQTMDSPEDNMDQPTDEPSMDDQSMDNMDDTTDETASEATDLVGTLVADDTHSTLVAAVTAADLVQTLQSSDFTVLAPSNEAFDALPAGTVATLVKPENKATLTNILLYHVLAGKVDLHSMENGAKLKTVLGQELTLVNEGYGLQVIDGKGSAFDLSDEATETTSGNIYTLDQVLIPS
jgi:uncharacterized surface protein with fasciclin (FAS1) repeats